MILIPLIVPVRIYAKDADFLGAALHTDPATRGPLRPPRSDASSRPASFFRL